MPGTADITIRLATTEDATIISRNVSELSRQFITPDYTSAGAASLLSYQTPQAICQAIADETIYLVAEIQHFFVGTVGVLPGRRHLYHLFVAQAHHRHGIGRRLWDEARTALGPGPVTVNSSRYAIGFYERLGFVSAGPPWEKEGVIAYPMRWEEPETTG